MNILPANMDGGQGAWADVTYAFQQVVSFVSGEPILKWALLIAIVVGIGSAIGKIIGEGVKTMFSIVAGIAGFALILYIAHSLGIF